MERGEGQTASQRGARRGRVRILESTRGGVPGGAAVQTARRCPCPALGLAPPSRDLCDGRGDALQVWSGDYK